MAEVRRRRWLRALGMVFVGLVVVLAAGLATLVLMKPKMRPASTEKVERTPERLERGRFLAEVLVGCMDCHSSHRNDVYGWPVDPATYGEGGLAFDQKLGFPGKVCAQNITQDMETGIGGWTDGEIMRAVREGVAKDGHALFPMMPYQGLRAMSDEDMRSVVVYLRSVKPVHKQTPEVQLDFPVNYLIKLAPRPLDGPVPTPTPSDGLAYGKYLTVLAGCVECHTQHEKGDPVAGMEFAGGWVLSMPWGRVVTLNITPDPETGIGNMTREQFIGRFKAFEGMQPTSAAPGRNTIMPWLTMAKLPESDLGAIYDYLRTVKPIKNKIATAFPDAPKEG
jgi:mono/diheme cytochrome c family protein